MKKMDFVRHNERTITDRGEFRKEMALIRKLGYSVDRAEQFEGIHCIGAPVLDQFNSMVGSLWISGAAVGLPAEKFTEYGPVVREHALRISRRLGYHVMKESTP